MSDEEAKRKASKAEFDEFSKMADELYSDIDIKLKSSVEGLRLDDSNEEDESIPENFSVPSCVPSQTNEILSEFGDYLSFENFIAHLEFETISATDVNIIFNNYFLFQ